MSRLIGEPSTSHSAPDPAEAGLREALDDVSKAYAQHRQGKLGLTGVSYALHVAEAALRRALAQSSDGSLDARLREWLADKRSTPWSGPASLTAEEAYETAVHEVEALL